MTSPAIAGLHGYLKNNNFAFGKTKSILCIALIAILSYAVLAVFGVAGLVRLIHTGHEYHVFSVSVLIVELTVSIIFISTCIGLSGIVMMLIRLIDNMIEAGKVRDDTWNAVLAEVMAQEQATKQG